MAITLLVLNLVKLDFVIIISSVLAILLVASIVSNKIRSKIAVPLCLGAALFACLVFVVGNNISAPQLAMDEQEVNASFYYVDIPTETDDGNSYIVKTVSIDKENAPQNIKLKINTNEAINAKPYQVVNAKLKLYKTGDNAYSSYGSFAKGIYLSANAEDISVTNKYVSSPWLWIYNLRVDIIKTLSKALNGDIGSLASALVTGYKKNLSNELNSAFKFSGASHLIAVSGFHLTVLTFLLFFVLKRLHANKSLIAVLGIAVVIISVGLAGFSKSIIRAGIMMSVMLLSNASKNKADRLNSLGLAISLICLNPYAVTDVGAQLSVLSVLSLVVFAPRLQEMNRLVRTAVIPWLITLFTLPAMVVSFGYVSISGLIANVVDGFLGALALIFSFLSYGFLKIGFLSKYIVLATKYIIIGLIDAVEFFARLKFAVVPISSEVKVIVLGAFALIAVALASDKIKWKRVMISLAFVMVYVSIFASIFLNYNTAYVLATKSGAVAVACRDEGYAFGVNNNSDYYTVKAFLFANHIDIEALEDYNSFKNINVFDSSSNCEFVVNGVTVVSSDERVNGADITVCYGSVFDSNGEINTNNGDVLYKIKANSSYEASWLKH